LKTTEFDFALMGKDVNFIWKKGGGTKGSKLISIKFDNDLSIDLSGSGNYTTSLFHKARGVIFSNPKSTI
jgi:hypothetical protein